MSAIIVSRGSKYDTRASQAAFLGARTESRASGPTIMSATSGTREIYSSGSMPFRSAMDIAFVVPSMSKAKTGGDKGKCPCLSQRYVYTVLASMALAITYGLKVNFHVCIVTMINKTALALKEGGAGGGEGEGGGGSCLSTAGGNDSTPIHPVADGPFAWSAVIQGFLLSAYFYGYIVTQVIGGRLAEVFSAKWTMAGSVFFNSLFTLLTPVGAHAGWGFLLALRVLEGMLGGVTLPATHVMLAKWSPKEEMSRISSAVYAGLSLGTVLSVSCTGLTADALGWDMVFYTQGGMAMFFVIMWCLLVYDSPGDHPWISQHELHYIEDSTGQHGGGHQPSPPVPWKDIWKSKPFWAVLISHTGSNFGWYMLLTELPTYMSGVLGFKIKANALLSAIPFLVMWLYSILFGNLMDHLGERGTITRTQITKIATGISAYVPAVCLVAVSFVGCNKALAVFLLTMATGTFGSMYAGFLSNHIQIAPVFAGTLMAITNTVATIPGVVVPSFVGAMIEGHNTVGQWRIIFSVTSGLLVAHATQYMFLASGEEQEWSARAHSDGQAFDVPAGH